MNMGNLNKLALTAQEALQQLSLIHILKASTIEALCREGYATYGACFGRRVRSR